MGDYMFKVLSWLPVLLGLLAGSNALADSNEAYIRQIGDLHNVTVNQSSNNSSVRVIQQGDFFGAGLGLGVLRSAWGVPFLKNSKAYLDGVDTLTATVILGANTFPGAAASHGNTGDIIVTGDNSAANLFQTGNNNSAVLKVSGNNAKGTIWQRGNDNQAGLAVVGNGTKVLYTQNGNGLRTVDLAPGNPDVSGNMLTVYAPGRTVSVHQQ